MRRRLTRTGTVLLAVARSEPGAAPERSGTFGEVEWVVVSPRIKQRST